MKPWAWFVIGVSLVCGSLCIWPAFVLWESSQETVTRLPSPDGRRTASVVRTNGGATTSYGYFVRVDGEEAAMAYGVSIGGRYGVRVRWLDANTLEVAFDHAASSNGRRSRV